MHCASDEEKDDEERSTWQLLDAFNSDQVSVAGSYLPAAASAGSV